MSLDKHFRKSAWKWEGLFSLWKWILAPSRCVAASLTLSNERWVIKKEYFCVQQLFGSTTSQNPAVVVRVCFRGKMLHVCSNTVQASLSPARVSPARNPALTEEFSSLLPKIDVNWCCGCCFTSGTWTGVFAGHYTVLTLFYWPLWELSADVYKLMPTDCGSWQLLLSGITTAQSLFSM